MSREIKFRVWDKHEYAWLKGGHLLSSVGSTVIDVCGYEIDGDWWETPNDVEIMQYTGLRDKNGTEIYEGDVVKMPLGRPNCAVTWWGAHWLTFVLVSDLSLVEKKGYGDLARYGNHVEVIGNIYENPELLSSESDEH